MFVVCLNQVSALFSLVISLKINVRFRTCVSTCHFSFIYLCLFAFLKEVPFPSLITFRPHVTGILSLFLPGPAFT